MRQNLSASDIRRILKRLDQIEDSLKAIRDLLVGSGYSPGSTTVTGTNAQAIVTNDIPVVLGGSKDAVALLKDCSLERRRVKIEYHKGKKNVKH